MTLLMPAFLWLLIPIGLLFLTQKVKSVQSSGHILVLALLVFALSRPAIHEGLQESRIEAKNIMVAVDVSYSMRAKDIVPDRYSFAKATINAFLEQNAKDNIMLVAFTSNPLLLSPPTTDHVLIATALKSLNPDYILTKGTSLQKLFRMVSSLKGAERTLILMTDGGEGENVQALAETLNVANVKLIVLGLGTTAGATIEKPDGTLVKDEKGHLIVSRLHPMLQTLTQAVDGTYLSVSSSAKATADTLQNTLNSLSQAHQEISKKQQRHKELYQIPLLLAALLFLLLHTRAVRYLLPLFLLLGLQAEASVWDGYYLHTAYTQYAQGDFNATKKSLKKIDDRSLQSQLALANTYYRLGQYKKAVSLYNSIRSTSVTVKQQLYYNRANAYVMLGLYDKARRDYSKVLQLGEDADAEHNLNLVALLERKEVADLGIAHPKSQNSNVSKSQKQDKTEEEKNAREEDQPSSGSGSGGEQQKKKIKEQQKKGKLQMDEQAEQQPLSSKVYELINKGYIRETQPW